MKVSVLVIVLAACGGGMGPGDDVPPNHVTPMLIATGGVADAPLSGELHVYAVETGTSTPISGATIRVETATPLTGQTDATGLASFTDGALSGAVTITATAPGHAAKGTGPVPGTRILARRRRFPVGAILDRSLLPRRARWPVGPTP